MLMLPNLALAMFPAIPHLGQVWSIGVEEQFYLLWPWLVRKSMNFMRTAIGVFLVVIFLKGVVLLLCRQFPDSEVLGIIKAFLAMSKIECMAIGAAGAYLFFKNNERLLSVVYHPLSQVVSFL